MKKSNRTWSTTLVACMLCTAILAGCTGSTPPATSAQPDASTADSSVASAQNDDYPNKPIQLVVPYGAGGDTDLNGRVLSKYLTEELGQSVVVSNVTGASGAVGSKKVLDSAPDGYTVLFNHPTMLMNTALGLSEVSYADFENGGIACMDNANVFVVSADSPYMSLNDIVKDAKANPGKIRFATSLGSFTHLQILAFQKTTGTEINAADLGDMAAYIVALLGGNIEIIGCQYGLVKDYITSGQFRCLGVLSEDRNPLIPDVPTFKEQGIDISFSKFFFFSFPKGTPANVISRFSSALESVCKNEEYIKEANGVYVTPVYMAPEMAVEYINENNDLYANILEGITLS